MDKKYLKFAILGGVGVVVLFVLAVSLGGQTVSVGGVTVSPPTPDKPASGPSADPGFAAREQECIAKGGRLVKTSVMNVCVP